MAEEEYDDDVEEEFSVWKRNTPLLYDLVVSHPLPWPSLTVHWLHSSPQPHSHPSFNLHKILYATHTSNSEPNYLILADVALPANPSQPVAATVDSENPVLPKVEVTQRIMVDGEVNRARSMPQNPSFVAAKTCGSEVYVFDVEKQRGKEEGGRCDPDLRLRGHDKEGYGLSWSPFKKGYLLSGSHDSKICMWDVLAAGQDNALDAIHVYEAHEGVVGDVSWHSKDESLFGSVGDDCKLIIWDLRTNKAQQSVKAHENEVNFLSFNPYNEWIVATASSDTTIALFDTRKLAEPLHVLSSHTDEVYQVEWDPNHETVLASSGADRRLNVWDLNRVGDEQNEGDGEGGPPELLFSHGGHKGKISDFSWNKNLPWVISSVAEDNSFHVWQMAENIYNEDGDDEDIWTADDQN
ncbi:adenyl-nucleotide exchange factor [Stylosanthes scabra]|uniref:Adenyl-nucleotide exchange factor n=1 Tax=Stylosanthes scabra TaxID=79078 RepID=A0ABU6STV0_9FABA|nr:adenyl-nucleotide exchange factor [Stylosanthes scabra]